MKKILQTNLSSEASSVEEARIKAAYAKRNDKGYQYSFFNPGQLFMIQERERKVLQLLKIYGSADLMEKKILEVGCGTGDWLRDFIKWGATPDNLTGIDLLDYPVSEARQRCPPAVTIQSGSATELTFPNASFDIVLQSTVFTSVLDNAVKHRIASELLRVLKTKGLILWYDYHVDNPWNPDVRGIKKREIHRLFPGCTIDLRRITLAPPIVRQVAPFSWLVAYLLERISVLCTHYVGIIQKAG